MTRKDYKLIARTLAKAHARILAGDPHPASVAKDTAEDIAHDLAAALASDNPRFDSARFLRACRGGDK